MVNLNSFCSLGSRKGGGELIDLDLFSLFVRGNKPMILESSMGMKGLQPIKKSETVSTNALKVKVFIFFEGRSTYWGLMEIAMRSFFFEVLVFFSILVRILLEGERKLQFLFVGV